jgi:xanthine/CO dehydrogenase XdhC/CoxF family maturation factor
MNDLDAIIAARNAVEAGAAPAMATVVRCRGSTYRRPGARMFVYPEGRRVGAVSGGCLEADVARHAEEILRTGVPETILYDGRISNGDVVAEMGCNGSVEVFVEPAASAGARAALELLVAARTDRRADAMATITRSSGAARLSPGDRLFRSRPGAAPGAEADGPETAMLRADFEEALRLEQPIHRTVDVEGGSVEALIEPILPRVVLLCCGGGQDTAPLLQLAGFLGWQAIALDRPGPGRMRELPAGLPSMAAEGEGADRRCAAVVMTHNYERDVEWLKALLTSPVGYIGLLGPRQRTLRLLCDAEADGVELDAERRARLYGPAGLDLGSETPEEIALAIVAEIQALMNRRSGGPLRERAASIHTPAAEASAPLGRPER